MSSALLKPAQQRLTDIGRLVDGEGIGAAGREVVAWKSALRAAVRDGSTLDQLISARWRGLAGSESVRCPVCGGQMTSRHNPVGGTRGCCLDCGSTLS